jgi:hypothetical protein
VFVTGYYFCMITEGSGTLSVTRTNESVSEFRRAKNVRILIRNTGFLDLYLGFFLKPCLCWMPADIKSFKFLQVYNKNIAFIPSASIVYCSYSLQD